MRSNVSISGIRLGRHCHETLLLMVALSDVCTFSYPPDGSPVSAGSEGSLSAPALRDAQWLPDIEMCRAYHFARKDEAGEKVTSSEYPPIIF